jgi:hypothetical protein
MKMIGLLGGMSWESSIVYEQIINEEVRRRLGGVHSADPIIRSYDFAHIERLQAAGDWEQAGALLAGGARTPAWPTDARASRPSPQADPAGPERPASIPTNPDSGHRERSAAAGIPAGLSHPRPGRPSWSTTRPRPSLR